MKVLVTGGTGFVGAYVIRYLLQKGDEVRAIHRDNSNFSLIEDVKDKIEWINTDLHDTDGLDEACKGIDQIYHVAALISFRRTRDKYKMLKINAEGTGNVVNAALSNGVKKLLYVSSVAALGTKSGAEISEKTKWEKNKYNTSYGHSKYLGEREVWRGMAEGLDVVIVNPSLIMGGGFWNSGTAKMFDNVYKNLQFYPSGINGFVDVRDVAEMTIALMNSTVTGEKFILSAESMAYKKVLSSICAVYGKPVPTIKAGKGLLRIALVFEQLKSTITGNQPLFSAEMLPYMTEAFYYKNDKVTSQLNRKFTPIEQTIRESADAYLNSKKENKDSAILPLRDLSSWMPDMQAQQKQE